MDSNERRHSSFEEILNLGKQRLDELKTLCDRLMEHLSPADLLTLLFPPALGLDVLYGVLSKEPIEDDAFNPEYPEPELLDAALNLACWLSKYYFRTTVHDVERFPSDTPVLLVGNHNGGIMPLDALFAINEIREHLGKENVVHPLVHDFAYLAPRVAKSAKRMGILRAKRENAMDALRAGRHVLVYPGGDEDAFRTFQERNRVILAERHGFIQLAASAGVPIVPLVSAGLQESFLVLSKGRAIGQKLGLKKILRTEIFPIALSLPWGLAPAFAPFLPLPTSIEMCFGEPIRVDADPGDEEAMTAAYHEIVDTMQSMMDELTEGRTPVIGR
jgi:1-acyl-sn-glycerol-3-phosphate acyltransferase